MRRAYHLVSALALCALPAVMSAPGASAATCTPAIAGPNDPDFAKAERGLGTFNSEQWYLFDCIPRSAPLASDPEGAAGMSVNRAWREFGRGSEQVTIAYMEGGVNWRRPDAKDFRRKVYLNPGELPAPRNAQGREGPDDLDRDGAFTADDFKNDPRVRRPLLHTGTAGGITPEDLIVSFSDGSDTDGNGYTDDISGWNFHRDTNDPQVDQSVYGHANSEIRVAAGEADNNTLGAGVCPRCRVLPVKLGDEAIDRPDRVAEGILFAVDSGAKVIDVTSATLGQTPAMQKAVDYAHDRGVVIAWASNDFESADHTEGMRLARVWPGNGVVSDQTNRITGDQPTDAAAVTFRSRSSVTSYGSHSLFSVSSSDGSTSHSIPVTAGVAAMVHSAGIQAGRGLTANEVFQVTRATVSPIPNRPCPTCFAGIPNAEFNIQYGYGRPNVHRAMKAVREGNIPPTADIRTPDWYAQSDPTRDRRINVAARVAARRASGYRYEIQYAPGPQPRDAEFKTFASGTGKAARLARGSLSLSKIPRSFWSGRYRAPTADRLSIERYHVTLRVRVVDAMGRVGVDRRTVVVRHDPDEIQALRKNLGSSAEASPTLADLEGRGRLDVIVATSDGKVHAFRPSGKRVPGWPVKTKPARGVDPRYRFNYLRARSWRSRKIPRPNEPIASPPAVGDLDHDGGLDVVVTGLDGRVYVWDARGKRRKGFPGQTDRRFARQSVPPPDTPYRRNGTTGSFGGAALADLDGDKKLEIVMGGWDGRVYAWRRTGRPQPGWPVSTELPESAKLPPGTLTYARDDKVATTPTIVDVDGDKLPDVVVALQDTSFGPEKSPVYGFVTAYSSKGRRRPGGALLPNFPVRLFAAVQGYGTAQDFITEGVQTPAAYISGGRPKLVANAGLSFSQTVDLRSGQTTQQIPGTLPTEGALNPVSPLLHFSASPTVGRLGERSEVSAVQGASAGVDVATAVAATPGLGIKVRSAIEAWNPANGQGLGSHTQPIQGLAFLSAPAIADISGDGRPDSVLATDSAALHGFDGNSGAPVPGWPKWTGGWSLFTPAVGDLGGNGRVEVVVGLREGYLRAFRTPGRATANDQAWHWHQNDHNSGLHGQDTRPPAAVRKLRARRRGRRDLLRFIAPGDDWLVGRAVRYELYRSRKPIRSLRKVKKLRIRLKPAGPGRTQRLSVRRPLRTARQRRTRWYYAIRAVDATGNRGPLPGKKGARVKVRRKRR